jgi:hypothetical protein
MEYVYDKMLPITKFESLYIYIYMYVYIFQNLGCGLNFWFNISMANHIDIHKLNLWPFKKFKFSNEVLFFKCVFNILKQ